MNARRTLAWAVAAFGLCHGTSLAYSDEAIADADALLKTLQDRATFGEVTAQDLAVTRFYRLELRLAAGKLQETDFCAQAQAELRTMITAEGDEVTKAGMAERKTLVDAMTQSIDACRRAVSAIDLYLFDLGDTARSPKAAAETEQALAEGREKYKTGEIDRTTLTRLEADVLDAQYASGTLTRQAYCEWGQATTLRQLTDTVEQRALVGQAGLLERIAAKRRYWAFKALCPGK